MPTNLEKFQTDLEALIKNGEELSNAIQAECAPEEFKALVKKQLGNKTAG
jgi:hypothetical protein